MTFVAPATTCAFVRIVAVAVDDEARAGRLAALLLGEAEVERRLRVLDDLRADEHDAGRGALVDVAAGSGRRRRRRVLVAAQRRLLDDRRRVAAAEVELGDDRDRREAAEQRPTSTATGRTDFHRMTCKCSTRRAQATLNRFLEFLNRAAALSRPVGLALDAGELAARRLGVGRAHQALADEHRVDADALEVVELLAGVDAGLGRRRSCPPGRRRAARRCARGRRRSRRGRGC